MQWQTPKGDAPAADPATPKATAEAPRIDAEMAQKITQLRAALRENFGKVVMALSMVPRYRSQILGDLQHLVLDPMLQDRIASPSRCTVQAPHNAMPQPNLVPVRCATSLNAHKIGISSATSSDCSLPLMFKIIMIDWPFTVLV